MKRLLKKHKWKLIISILTFAALIYGNHLYVSYSASDQLFSNPSKIAHCEYGLLLGTPKYLQNGKTNNYYKNRIETVALLFRESKIDKIIISADSANKYGEDEVELIKSDLINLGIDESNLLYDKNGNSTWKSITNVKKVLGDKRVIIISQEFHLERAVYIAEAKGVKALGFIAKGKMSSKLWLREILARVKMRIDLLSV